MIRNLIFGSGLSFSISLINMILVARLFPLALVSDLKGFILYGGLFATIGTFQLHSGYLYFSNSDDMTKNTFHLCMLSIGVAGVLTSAAFFLLFPSLYASSKFDIATYALLSGCVFYNVLFIATPAVYTGKSNSKSIPVFTLLYSASQFLAVLATFFLKGNMFLFAGAYFTSATIAFLFSSWPMYFKETLQSFMGGIQINKDYFSYSVKVSVSNTFEALGDKIDKLFITSFFSKAIFAKYAVLAFESPITNILLSAYGVALVKRFSGQPLVNSALLLFWRNAYRTITLVTFPIAAMMFFYSSEVVSLLFGQRFVDMAFVFQLYALISVFRPAPFQALLRMKGLAHYNIVIAGTFCLCASLVGWGILRFELNYQFMPLAILSGWILFNSGALLLFSTKTNTKAVPFLCLDIWCIRICQSFGSAYIAALISETFVVSVLLYCAIFVFITLATDRQARHLATAIAKKISGRRGA